MENWIHIDEADDVLGSLRHAGLSILAARDDEQAWKWVVLALHSALQGACVCHLVTSATPYGAVSARNATQWLEYFENSRNDSSAKAPKTQLMALPDLLKAVRKANSAGDRSNLSGVLISDEELRWLTRLHEDVRNQFTHFKPMSWYLDVSGIPELCRIVARIIAEILTMGYAFRHKDSHWRARLSDELTVLVTTSHRPSQ